MFSSQDDSSDQYAMRTGLTGGVPAYPAFSQDDDPLGRLAANFRNGYQSDNSNSQNAMDQSDFSFTQRIDENYENNGYVNNSQESTGGHFSFLQAQIKRDRSNSSNIFASTLSASKHRRSSGGGGIL